MLSQAARSIVSWPRPLPTDPDTTMIDLLGVVDGLHVVVIGPGGLVPMLSLHRLGAASVTRLCQGRGCGVAEADAAVIPRIETIEMAEGAIGLARRMIRPLNSLVLRLVPDPRAALLPAVRRILFENGFAVVRTLDAGSGTVLLAELPLFGRPMHA